MSRTVEQFEILKDVAISNVDTTGHRVVVTFSEGEVVSPAGGPTLRTVEKLVNKGLAKPYVKPKTASVGDDK